MSEADQIKSLEKIQHVMERLDTLYRQDLIPEPEYMELSNILEEVLNDNGVNTHETDF